MTFVRPFLDSPARVIANTPFAVYHSITGRVPSYLWRGDSLASVIPELVPQNLAAAGAALHGQAFPGPGVEGEPLESALVTSAFQYPNLAGAFHQPVDALSAPDPTVLDFDGTTSWAISVLFRSVADAFPTNTGAILGKRDPIAPNNGWELLLSNTGQLTLQWRGASGVLGTQTFQLYNNTAGQHLYADGRWHTVDIEFDVDAGAIRSGNEHEPTMASAWIQTSLSTGTTFRIGAVRGFAAPVQVAFVAISFGAQAIKGDPSVTAQLLAEETSLVVPELHVNERLT